MRSAALVALLILVWQGVLSQRALAAAGSSWIYEAEEAELVGVTIASQAPGFSGTGYVTGFDQPTDALKFTVQAPSTGLYDLVIGYRAASGEKRLHLQVNGAGHGEVVLLASTTFTETPPVKTLLAEGTNTITILQGWGWYDVDYIRLSPAEPPAPGRISKELVNPDATPEARALMSYLVDMHGRAILSGQQDYSNLPWLFDHVGKLPAIVGFDFMDDSPSRVARGTRSNEIQRAISWHRQGGIVTFLWHWNAPKDLIDEPGGKEWWRGFYTEATTFDVEYAINNPDSEDYRLILRDIDAIAAKLKELQDAGVPVLFRPLHEAEGGWFWWGAKGPEPAKALWRLLFDRLTHHHGLNNLIWVWNSVSPQWYPGDDVVDIVSFDSYPPPGDYGPVIQPYESLQALVQGKKLIALTENGAIPDPDLLPVYGAYWSWFCTWTGDFLTGGSHNSLEHLKKVYHSEYVITHDELPDWSNGNPFTPIMEAGR